MGNYTQPLVPTCPRQGCGHAQVYISTGSIPQIDRRKIPIHCLMCKALPGLLIAYYSHPRGSLVSGFVCPQMATATMSMSPEQTQAALRTLLEGPAMSPPAGVVPNFDDPANLDVYFNVTITLCIAFSTVAVILRMYTKVCILRVLAWEDCEFCFLSQDVAPIYLLLPLRCHCPCMGTSASPNSLTYSDSNSCSRLGRRFHL